MKIKKIRLDLGLEKSLRVIHITDSHLSYADEQDTEFTHTQAVKRRDCFRADSNATEYGDDYAAEQLRRGVAYAADADLLVLTGDVIDFYSHANLVLAQEILKDANYLCTAGNHEFAYRVGEPDLETTKLERLPEVQKYFKTDLRFASRQIGGVNFVAVDDCYDNFAEFQIALLEQELEKGLPILLFLHSPLPTAPLGGDAVEATRNMNELINRRSDLIKAVFAGHWHGDGIYLLPGGRVQYVQAGGFRDALGEIEIY